MHSISEMIYLISSSHQLASCWCTYWLHIIIAKLHSFTSKFINSWSLHSRTVIFTMITHIIVAQVVNQYKQYVRLGCLPAGGEFSLSRFIAIHSLEEAIHLLEENK